jgi:cytochrome b involved in lipid metabolism
MNKVIGIIIAILVIIGIIFVAKRENNDTSINTNPTPVVNIVATTTNATSTDPLLNATTTKIYTMTDVAMHSNVNSCWAAISGKVYDLTTWIPKHPGGPDKILAICGKDGTSAFMGQHGSNEKIVAGLQTFYIGNLQ